MIIQEFAQVNVEAFVTVDMKIELTTPKDLELTGPAVFAVEQAKVAMPASVAKEITTPAQRRQISLC